MHGWIKQYLQYRAQRGEYKTGCYCEMWSEKTVSIVLPLHSSAGGIFVNTELRGVKSPEALVLHQIEQPRDMKLMGHWCWPTSFFWNWSCWPRVGVHDPMGFICHSIFWQNYKFFQRNRRNYLHLFSIATLSLKLELMAWEAFLMDPNCPCIRSRLNRTFGVIWIVRLKPLSTKIFPLLVWPLLGQHKELLYLWETLAHTKMGQSMKVKSK